MSDVAPISLYLDLEDGRCADLEVVARAAIAWAEAIKEVSYIFDPSIEIRVELASGTTGSLSLNSIIRKIRDTKGIESDANWVALVVVLWFLNQTLSYGYAELIDYMRNSDKTQVTINLSDAQMNDIASRIAEKVAPSVGQSQRRQVFRELERDPVIKGVGVTTHSGDRPAIVVPRTRFLSLSESTTEATDISQRRSSERLPVTLISPILKGKPRSWRFQVGSLPEFGATMKDEAFLAAIEDGRIPIQLKSGVAMEIELSVKEENQGGVWVVKERAVTKVYSPQISRDAELPF